MKPLRVTLAAALALSACAPADLTTSVRHVASTKLYGEDARFHLFVFDPAEPRPFAERVGIARRAIAREIGCAWVDAPEDVLRAETERQAGALRRDTLLAAPLRCREA